MSTRRRNRASAARWALGALAGVAPCLPAPLHAAAEEEWQLGLMLSGGGAVVSDDMDWGGGVAADVQYGLSDALALHGALGTSWFQAPSQEAGALGTRSGVAGVVYTLDVLRVLPFAEAGVAVVSASGPYPQARLDLGLQLGLGGDYLLDRRWSLGLVAQYTYLPVELKGASRGAAGAPALVALAVRLSYRLF